jgi:hypothetical protein
MPEANGYAATIAIANLSTRTPIKRVRVMESGTDDLVSYG